MAVPTPETQFTRDILGNYMCNTFAEAAGSGPFDVVIVGGGTFGLSLAQDLFFRSKRSGPGSDPQELIAQGKDKQAILENWGLPWNSTERFGGLAYCLGGRSLYFGGWSPRYLETEMHTAPAGSITSATLWPAAVVQDLTLERKLKKGFQLDAAKQTGVSAANDYINGDLHDF